MLEVRRGDPAETMGADSPSVIFGAYQAGLPWTQPSWAATGPIQRPDSRLVRLHLAAHCIAQGQPAQAEAIYRELLAEQPTLAVAWSALGVLLADQRRALEARSCFEQASIADPQEPTFPAQLAELMRRHKLWPEALAFSQRAVALGPRHPTAQLNHAWVLLDLNRPQEALTAFLIVTQVAPTDPVGWFGLARAHMALAAYPQAIDALETCLRAVPDHVDALLNLAQAHRLNNNAAQAQAINEALMNRVGTHPTLLALQFDLLVESGQSDQAHALIDRIQPHPLPPALAYRWALSLLERGRYEEGFRAYERRLELTDQDVSNRVQIPWLPFPRWDGVTPLKGRRLLVLTEQGFGDHIQFCRCVSLLAQQGWEVTLAVSEPLADLMRGLPGVHRVLVRIEDVRSGSFDAWAPVCSLPYLTRLWEQPALWLHPQPAYLHPPPAPRQRWRQWLDQPALQGAERRLTVGLVWSGRASNDYERRRSPEFRAFDPWAELSGVRWLGLQTGARAADPLRTASPLNIQVLSDDQLGSFADTAALMDVLDLVVCVDTAFAHLAGAMGKEVWLLLPKGADWRWSRRLDAATPDEPPRSAWYPSIRIVQQATAGDWAPVVEVILRALRQRVAATPAHGAEGIPADEEVTRLE